ncbi:hypothetical protein [Brevundimonas faecalis]|uniref:Uncharacterized protein n=1 Tax=Brevundimonas faecalis TaxID=947378 RepID=A0ABV2RF01_9CAUL
MVRPDAARFSRDRNRPAILTWPRRLLAVVGAILALLLLVYLATAATGFLRTEQKVPDPQMTGGEAPLERAM